MKPVNKIKIQFESRSCNEGFARVACASAAAQLDPILEELNELKTAVSEAVTNAIVHGYKTKVGMVYIEIKIFSTGKIVISIRDKGCGIKDIAAAMTPMYTTGEAEERAGMGFTVMQTFCDKVKVYSGPDKGTKVVLEKTFRSKM